MSENEKIVVITGVSKGLGYALMERFAEEGHRVFGCARRPPRTNSGVAVATVDVGVAEEVSDWAESLLNQFEAPDILISNAAVITPPAKLWEVPAPLVSRLIDVNIKGVVHTLQSFVPSMVARGRGLVVTISSEWGRSVAAGVAPYCCSKWAVEGLTRALAEELPSGLSAVPLNPGIINTDMLQTVFGEDSKQYPAPAEWARKAVPYILSLGGKDNGKPRTVP